MTVEDSERFGRKCRVKIRNLLLYPTELRVQKETGGISRFSAIGASKSSKWPVRDPDEQYVGSGAAARSSGRRPLAVILSLRRTSDLCLSSPVLRIKLAWDDCLVPTTLEICRSRRRARRFPAASRSM